MMLEPPYIAFKGPVAEHLETWCLSQLAVTQVEKIGLLTFLEKIEQDTPAP